MVRASGTVFPVEISADELRSARVRAGYSSQAALAEALGVSERTVQNWETGEGVSKRAEGRVRDLLWPKPPERHADKSDAALIAEVIQMLGIIGQRLADREQRSPMQPPTGETSISDVNTGEEQSSQEPVGGSTTTGQRRIRGRGPRRNLGQ